MLYLAFIFHMHQPYYKNLLTHEASLPWVRLHGLKDYLDMVAILKDYPRIHQTFNLVPSLIEQVEDYCERSVKDEFLELSYKPAEELTAHDKAFIRDKFFMINPDKVIATFPRYYELYFKKRAGKSFTTQDDLDLQVLFNLAWTDPSFRQAIPELRAAVGKGRFFSEEDKMRVLNSQIGILEEIVPTYKKFVESGQVEVTTTPYYHPILPLLYNTGIAKEANPKTILPKAAFSYPEDALAQIDEALKFHKSRFGSGACGMWPSEESVCEQIVPFFIEAGIRWIVTDEAILFKSLKHKHRDTKLLYQPHILKRKGGELNIIFRDRNLSDLIGFTYHKMKIEDAVNDFINHMKNIYHAFKDEDILVTVAMDGENAWEYYSNDGHDFLNLLYKRLSDEKFINTTTVSDYLKAHPAKSQIKHLSPGSWIFGNFGKWMDNPHKAHAWDRIREARKELDGPDLRIPAEKLELAWKQIHVLEGSDWFWWYGEDPDGSFDRLFRTHLSNFYAIIGKDEPAGSK